MSIAHLYKSFIALKVLLDSGALVNPIMRNSKGQLMTPLDAAIYKGFRGCAKFLQLNGGLPAIKLTDRLALQRALTRLSWPSGR
jgi:hypothetical protein